MKREAFSELPFYLSKDRSSRINSFVINLLPEVSSKGEIDSYHKWLEVDIIARQTVSLTII